MNNNIIEKYRNEDYFPSALGGMVLGIIVVVSFFLFLAATNIDKNESEIIWFITGLSIGVIFFTDIKTYIVDCVIGTISFILTALVLNYVFNIKDLFFTPMTFLTDGFFSILNLFLGYVIATIILLIYSRI